ncbi:MAG: hypothetical protein KW788_00075 [Candidatus Doudnabacteria bacterium]|nr:hypothetical protein [Candidatus Doudnabacteria bacterium]
MRKQLAAGIATASLIFGSFVLFSLPATNAASAATLSPWVYDPGAACPGVSSTVSATGALTLSKPCPTPTNASAGAQITGLEGQSTTGLTLSYDVAGYCGAGAPRFNVYLSDGSTVFLGCIYGNDGTGHVSFTAGNTYGGVLFPTGATITGIDIVQDETGTTTLSNISVNGTPVMVSAQTLKDQCKNGGWMTMTDASGNSFKNQGQCVSYFARQK